jgi:hypothetical protein
MSDLQGMLEIFAVSDVSAAAEPLARADVIWRETIESEAVAVFVADAKGEIVSTCVLVTAPNLLRGGKRHPFLQNVVTRLDFRGRGLVVRLFKQLSNMAGAQIATMSSCKVEEPIRECTPSMKVWASAQACASATLLFVRPTEPQSSKSWAQSPVRNC